MSLDRLINKCDKNNARFTFRYNPEEERTEQWGLKYYPDANDNAHYYAYASTLDECIHKLLSEIEGF